MARWRFGTAQMAVAVVALACACGSAWAAPVGSSEVASFDRHQAVPASRTSLRWYKGNLHTHTLVSDGQALPVEAAVLYRDAGYHFLMFSDHNRLHERESWVNATVETLIDRTK